MRNFLWSLVLLAFKKELRLYTNELANKNENDRVYYNYPQGQKVIIRSNEPNDLVIGEVIGYKTVGTAQPKVLLVVRDEKTNRLIVSFNNSPAYWSKARESALRKLNWVEQWNVMSKFQCMDEKDRLYKESPEYRKRVKISETQE